MMSTMAVMDRMIEAERQTNRMRHGMWDDEPDQRQVALRVSAQALAEFEQKAGAGGGELHFEMDRYGHVKMHAIIRPPK
jgi:hypothetical protein